MRYFILTHGRAATATTPHLLDGLEWWLCVHTLWDRELYRRAGWPENRILVTHTEPGPYGKMDHNATIYERYMAVGEWACFVDDDLVRITGVPAPWNQADVLPVVESPAEWGRLYATELSPEQIDKRCDEIRLRADYFDFAYGGFSKTSNHLFRSKKWKYVDFVVNGVALWKKTHKPFPLEIRTHHDDLFYSAEHLVRDGGVVIDQFTYPVASQYSGVGGFGTYSERAEAKLESNRFLQRRYPGFFKYAVSPKAGEDGTSPYAALDPKTRLRNSQQFERWRARMLSRAV